MGERELVSSQPVSLRVNYQIDQIFGHHYLSISHILIGLRLV